MAGAWAWVWVWVWVVEGAGLGGSAVDMGSGRGRGTDKGTGMGRVTGGGVRTGAGTSAGVWVRARLVGVGGKGRVVATTEANAGSRMASPALLISSRLGSLPSELASSKLTWLVGCPSRYFSVFRALATFLQWCHSSGTVGVAPQQWAWDQRSGSGPKEVGVEPWCGWTVCATHGAMS